MIDRDAFDRYDRALSTNADLVAAAVAALEREMDGLAFDEMVAALESRYRALVTEYGTYAAAVAVEFYAQQREASRPDTDYEAVQCYPKDWALLADDVKTEAVRGREVAEVLRSLAGRSQQRVMAYADETIDRNAALDPAHPKWAIVPHVGACAWCVTLGSFGFAYGSKSVAINARHPWCKCTPAPDFDRDKPYLSGYNPEEMYDSYLMCQDAVRDDAERRWAAMSEEERSRYASAGRVHKDGTRGKRRVDYQAYLKRRTVEEMGRRDRGWLQGLEYDDEFKILDGARPSKLEKDTAARLIEDGILPTFRPTRDLEMLKTSDVFIPGASGVMEEWDFKRPTGNGTQTIYHQFEEAAGQAHKVVIDLRDTARGGRYSDDSYALGMTAKFIDYGYKIESGVEKGAGWRFDEAIVITQSGSIKRVTR